MLGLFIIGVKLSGNVVIVMSEILELLSNILIDEYLVLVFVKGMKSLMVLFDV